ncbi:hypothetical protein RRG08_025247 [Elysia crispata]|uniref:Uncharacterized protein n=1 Tax=Elysia crispata TaxID=231223 RepID=A0AAE1AA01_9GAST|nr:hypothetical protein RRG08_025247 [Elysia crispata]
MPQFSLGIDFRIYTIELDMKKVKLQLWDTFPNPRCRMITRSYYRGAKGILMVYDITNRETFNSIRVWKRDVDDVPSLDRDLMLMLVGNKCDLQNQRQVSIEEGKQMAAEFGIWFMETSALEDINVEQAFVSLVQDIKEKVEARPPDVKEKKGLCILS